VLTLEGRSIRVYPGVSELPGVSGFAPDTPGLKASTAIFWVRGYKTPLHRFIYSSLLPFQPEHFRPHYSLPSPWLKFGEICCEDLRGFESKSLESASELISHLQSTSFFAWLAKFVFITLGALSS
jgi:hypothetical protein